MSKSSAVWRRLKTRTDACATQIEAHTKNRGLANSFETFRIDVKYSYHGSRNLMNERLTLMEALRSIFDAKSVDGKCLFHVLIDTILWKPQVFS